MSAEPKIYPEPVIDRETVVVRAICGALLGVGVALVVWMRNGGFGPLGSTILFGAAIAGCTFGAIRYGDDFWVRVLRRSR